MKFMVLEGQVQLTKASSHHPDHDRSEASSDPEESWLGLLLLAGLIWFGKLLG